MGMRRLLPTLLAALLALVVSAPLVWMVSVSLMAPGSADAVPPPLWPAHPTLFNYRDLFFGRTGEGGLTSYHILPAILNSVVLAVLATILSLLLTIPAGYAFARLRFTGRERLLQLLVAAVVVPGQVAMLPLFLMLRSIGLVDSYAGILAPGLAGIFAVLFVRQATLAIPQEMLDAARLDGAGEMQVFRRTVVPLLVPVIVTLALFAFLASWNDFLWPLIVITDRDLYTLPVALAAMSREHAGDTELMMAGSVVTTVPVLLLFLVLQRYYFTGMLGGSVKG